MTNLNDTIESYLRAGSSPDDIVKAINDAQRKISADKDKEKKISAAKKALSEALSNYLNVVTGEKLTKEEQKVFEDSLNEGLAEIEEMAQHYLSKKDSVKAGPRHTYVRAEKNGERDKETEDILKKYFDDLFKF